eukprot:GFYU01005400.1.p2 GENE.GFYU01005400.1~~GFYU01005400.1.p2  ORF type:complete len:100 (-),score=7.11 GFYU01005400.1:416-715(-)
MQMHILKALFCHNVGRHQEFRQATENFLKIWMERGAEYAVSTGFVIVDRVFVLGALLYLNGQPEELTRLRHAIDMCGDKTATESSVCESWLQRLASGSE